MPAHRQRVEHGQIRLEPGQVPEHLQGHRLIDVERDGGDAASVLGPGIELRVGVLEAFVARQRPVVVLRVTGQRVAGHERVKVVGLCKEMFESRLPGELNADELKGLNDQLLASA